MFDDFKTKLTLIWDKDLQYEFLMQWLEEPENNFDFDNLQEVLNLCDDLRSKSDFVMKWLEKPENIIDLKTFKDQILPLDIGCELSIIRTYLINQLDPEIQYENLKNIIQNNLLGSIYATEHISSMCKDIKLSNAKMFQLCKELYPNNHPIIRADLFKQLIQSGSFKKTKQI